MMVMKRPTAASTASRGPTGDEARAVSAMKSQATDSAMPIHVVIVVPLNTTLGGAEPGGRGALAPGARPLPGPLPDQQHGRCGPLDGESRHAAAGARRPQHGRAGHAGRTRAGVRRLYRLRGPGLRAGQGSAGQGRSVATAITEPGSTSGVTAAGGRRVATLRYRQP